MSFFQNTSNPKGFGGKIMVNMMNTGHSSMAEWGFEHIKIQDDDIYLDIGCGGGANIKKLLEKSPYGKVVGIDYSDVSVKKSQKINRAEIKKDGFVWWQRRNKTNNNVLPIHSEERASICSLKTIESGAVFRYT